MNELVVRHTAANLLKKLDRPIRLKVFQVLEKIARNPLLGQKLTADMKPVYSCHFRDNGVEYRIAYLFQESQSRIIVLLIGTRENFYSELRKQMK